MLINWYLWREIVFVWRKRKLWRSFALLWEFF